MHPSQLPSVLIGSTLVIGEGILAVIVIGMGATILVLRQRQNAPKKVEPVQNPGNMYGDLQQPSAQPQGFGPGAQADPFAGFGGAPSGQAAAPMAPAPAPAPAPQAAAGPANGTPAGWLPDPSGVPNTLRYWDGTAWTQHVAQRP